MSGSPPGRSGWPAAPTSAHPARPRSCWPASPPQGLEQLYAGTDRAELVRQLTAAKGFEGAALRYGDFFDALRVASTAPGATTRPTWPSSLPVLAAREDASAAFRLLLEDLGHYGVARKDRDDQGMTVYLEEFSAVTDGAGRPSTWPSGSGTPGSGWCSSSSPTRASVTSTRRPAAGQLGRAHRPSHAPARAAPGRRRDHLDPGADLAARPVGTGRARLGPDDPAAPGRPGRRAPRRGRRSMDHRRRPQPPPPGRRDPYTPQPAELPAPTGRPRRRRGAAAVGRRPCPTRSRRRRPVVAEELPPPRPGPAATVAGAAAVAPPARQRRPQRATSWPCAGSSSGPPGRAHLGRPGRAGRADRGPASAPPQPAAGVAGLANPYRPSTEDPAMTEDEIMRQLSQAVRDDDLLTAEELVAVGQQQHPGGPGRSWPRCCGSSATRWRRSPGPPATGLAAVAALAGRLWPPVRTGLACGAAPGGTPHPDADRPVACLLALPGRRPRQGRSASFASLRDGFHGPP